MGIFSFVFYSFGLDSIELLLSFVINFRFLDLDMLEFENEVWSMWRSGM